MLRAAEMESVATVVRISAHENGGSAVGGGNTLDSMGGGGCVYGEVGGGRR